MKFLRRLRERSPWYRMHLLELELMRERAAHGECRDILANATRNFMLAHLEAANVRALTAERDRLLKALSAREKA